MSLLSAIGLLSGVVQGVVAVAIGFWMIAAVLYGPKPNAEILERTAMQSLSWPSSPE